MSRDKFCVDDGVYAFAIKKETGFHRSLCLKLLFSIPRTKNKLQGFL